jgi:hypothetical protein
VYDREGWSKAELLRVAQENTPPPKFRVVEWVEEYNKVKKKTIKVLFLPVAHPILNPIELCWGHLKGTVRKLNIGKYEMEELKFLAQECQESEEQRAMWAKSYEHSYKYAVQQWKVDQLILVGDDEAVEEEAQELEEEPSDVDGEEEDRMMTSYDAIHTPLFFVLPMGDGEKKHFFEFFLFAFLI